ncbi:MAG: type II secretion system protein [Planctomycetota bacterium]
MTSNDQKGETGMIQKPSVHSIWGRKRRLMRRQQGFSLIEILVVISIITLIIGVGTAVALKMTAEARKEQTRAMMEGLISANTEHKAVRGAGIGVSASGGSSASQFVTACLQVKTCEEIMLAAMNSSTQQAFERTYKNGSIFDRWGTELEYRSSNNQTGNGPANQAGVTVANSALPLSRDPFFASAGPDKTWDTDDDITTVNR